MPKFEPDFENVKAQTQIFPKGDYELVFGNPFGFIYEGDKGTSYGVTLPVTIEGKVDSRGMLDESFKGQQAEMLKFWLHNDGSLKSTKRSLMGILGYTKKQEDEFNAWYKTQDFSVEGDEGEDGKYENITIGEGWKQFAGMHARCTLSPSIYRPKDGGEEIEQQKYGTFTSAKQTASV